MGGLDMDGCSMRTCWATIWMPGWPKPISTSALSAIAPSSPGLIERKMPGKEKSGRQVTFSSDLIYDVLREHEPDHVLLRATYRMPAPGCSTLPGSPICWRGSRSESCPGELDRVSPLGGAGAAGDFPRDGGRGEVEEEILRDNEDALMRAMRVD